MSNFLISGTENIVVRNLNNLKTFYSRSIPGDLFSSGRILQLDKNSHSTSNSRKLKVL